MTLLSLFDESLSWPAPFIENGWTVYDWDIKNGRDVCWFDSVESTFELVEDVDGILAACPCTDFSVSGAQYWPVKDSDGRTEKSLEFVRIVLRLVDLFSPTDPDYDGEFFWTVENPVGRIGKLLPELGTPFYFQPWEYAGHLKLTAGDHNELDRLRRKDGKGFCAEEIDFVIKCNAYTKKTGLWGHFSRDLERRPIEPVRCTAQGSPLMRFGGKSEATKQARSVTPLGFAWAFYLAQMGHSKTA